MRTDSPPQSLSCCTLFAKLFPSIPFNLGCIDFILCKIEGKNVYDLYVCEELFEFLREHYLFWSILVLKTSKLYGPNIKSVHGNSTIFIRTVFTMLIRKIPDHHEKPNLMVFVKISISFLAA